MFVANIYDPISWHWYTTRKWRRYINTREDHQNTYHFTAKDDPSYCSSRHQISRHIQLLWSLVQLDIEFPAISQVRAFQCLCGHLISRYFLSISNHGFLMLKRASNFPLCSTATGLMLTMYRNVCIIDLSILFVVIF